MFDGQNLFDQLLINNLRMHDGIRKTETGQGDDYSTGCLLDYNYFKNYYKVIAIDLSKYQALDADPEAIQQRSSSRCNNVFHYWKNFRLFTRNYKSILIMLSALI